MEPIRAVIGVWHKPDIQKTFYVKRSQKMENYPGVWSLTSIQYRPEELPKEEDLEAAQRIFDRMSIERFAGEPCRVHALLTTGRSDENPMQRMVELALYAVSFDRQPKLNRQFYTDSAWLTRYEFDLSTVLAPTPCGLCTKLWRAHPLNVEAAR